ncbi:MAG: glucose-6-phosphate isomerase, partial [Desulfitobacterium hafniense]|nr:glucose-6-phosphate isomerase [Desulfitobacterium hafniense]
MLNATSRLQIDYTGMMQSELNPSGWTIDQLGELQPMLDQAYSSLLKMRETGDLDFSKKLYEMLHEVDKLVEISNEIANSFENFVVLGIGGSALGPIAVHQALRPYYYNELPQEHRGRPRFYVIDNIDPVRFHDFLRVIDLKKTCFNVITKSGSTSETMAQFLIVRDMLKQVCGRDYNRHIIVTTDKEKGNLLPIALEEGYTRFEIPQGIGGRFSELTAVGLLPAAVCGIDITALLQGAIEMDTWVRDKKEIMQNPAQLRAGLSYLSWREKKNISVFMPYSDALKTMSDWYAQLWAESLGKRFNRDEREAKVG